MENTKNITISLAEYTRLLKCETMLQMIVNCTGYNKDEIANTAAEVYTQMTEGRANE